MSNDFLLNAEKRDDQGKGSSRRLRRLQEKVPAIIYGGKNKPEMLSIEAKDLRKSLENEAFYSHILTLNIDGKEEQAILRDLQRHPAKDVVLHADFLRVSMTEKLHMRVPLHFIGAEECVGVKTEGGLLSHAVNNVEISCLPEDLPEYLEIDVTALSIGDTLHLSDIVLPKGVEIIALQHGADHDLPVAQIQVTRAGTDEEEDAGEEEAGEEEGGEE